MEGWKRLNKNSKFPIKTQLVLLQPNLTKLHPCILIPPTSGSTQMHPRNGLRSTGGGKAETLNRQTTSRPYTQILGWPKSSPRFSCNILWKNPNELSGQPNTFVSQSVHWGTPEHCSEFTGVAQELLVFKSNVMVQDICYTLLKIIVKRKWGLWSNMTPGWKRCAGFHRHTHSIRKSLWL